MSNRVEPSRLQSRLPLGQDAGHSQGAYYRPTAAPDPWRQQANSLWHDRAILFGLWLLIFLVAAAIGLRFLDETDPSKMRPAAADALAGLDRPPARTPSVGPRDFAPVDDASDEPLPEPAGRGAPAAAPSDDVAQEPPLTPAVVREALAAAARSARESLAEPAEPRAEAMKTRQPPSLPTARAALPEPPARPVVPAQAREPEPDAAASLALPALPAHRPPALRSAASTAAAAVQKTAPACSEAQQAMQLCNVAVR